MRCRSEFASPENQYLAAPDADGSGWAENGIYPDGSDDTTDADGSGRPENGINADRSDDTTDADGSGRAQHRVGCVDALIDLDVPVPADGAVGLVDDLGRRGRHDGQGNRCGGQGEPGDRGAALH